MALDSLTAERWLQQKLSADATLVSIVGTRIFSEVAPADLYPEARPGSTGPKTASNMYPLCIYAFLGGNDVQVVDGVTIYLNCTYAVKAIGISNSYASLEAAAARIHTVLHRASGAAIGGGSVLACVREMPLKYVEQTNGIVYRHLGGVYRIYSQG